MQDNPSTGLREPRAVKIFVAYDQPEAGVRAEELCAQLEGTDEFSIEVQPWRINELAASEDRVRNSAIPADILVLAWSVPEGPPEFVFQWVMEWAMHRSIPNATLAALPVGKQASTAINAAIFHRLRQLCSATGMVFVCDWSEGLRPHAMGFAETLQKRQQEVTPTLVNILADHHVEPHLEWGLNE